MRSIPLPTRFLQAAVALIGAAALAFLLVEPHFEGRNARATLFEIYFKDPFLAYAYLGSVPFFAALWQAFRALGLAGRGEAFSPATADALRALKRLLLAFAAFVALGLVFILRNENDDGAGALVLGAIVAFLAAAAAAGAARLERIVREGAKG